MPLKNITVMSEVEYYYHCCDEECVRPCESLREINESEIERINSLETFPDVKMIMERAVHWNDGKKEKL